MPTSPVYITPDQLCVGLYIQLELGWWEHDFTFSNFKIRDDNQVAALRKLGLKRLRYDPSRSDCEPLPLQPVTAPTEPLEDTPPPPAPEEAARQAGEVVQGRRDLVPPVAGPAVRRRIVHGAELAAGEARATRQNAAAPFGRPDGAAFGRLEVW